MSGKAWVLTARSIGGAFYPHTHRSPLLTGIWGGRILSSQGHWAPDLIRCNDNYWAQLHEVWSLCDLKLQGISPGWLNFKSPDRHRRRHPRQAFFVPLNHLEENSEGAIPALRQTWQIQTRERRLLALGVLRKSLCGTWTIHVSLTWALQFYSGLVWGTTSGLSCMRGAQKGEDPHSPQIHMSTKRGGDGVCGQNRQDGGVPRASLSLDMFSRWHAWLRDPCN